MKHFLRIHRFKEKNQYFNCCIKYFHPFAIVLFSFYNFHNIFIMLLSFYFLSFFIFSCYGYFVMVILSNCFCQYSIFSVVLSVSYCRYCFVFVLFVLSLSFSFCHCHCHCHFENVILTLLFCHCHCQIDKPSLRPSSTHLKNEQEQTQ